jgi:glycosyltransferase involved in cell wall biosynthesis
MRVALLAHTNSPWTPHYARGIASRGHAVRVLSFHPHAIEGVDCLYVGRGEARPAAKGAYLRGVPRVRRALRAFAPDVVFAPYLSSNGLVAALAWRGPLVVSARGGDVLEQAGHLPAPRPFHGWLVRFVCARARAVHAVSEPLRDALVALGVPAARIACFPIGVDTERFRPREPAPGGPPRIVCTRRQEPVYENQVVVEALARLRAAGTEFEATLVGGGPLLEARRAQARALDLEGCVRFSGQIAHDELPALLAGADVYVSASSSDGTSSSLLEALACGCFPVVSRIPANEGWIREGETGAFFAVGDAAGLADRLAFALARPELRRRAAEANRAEVVRRGDQHANLERLLGLLEEAARGRSAR